MLNKGQRKGRIAFGALLVMATFGAGCASDYASRREADERLSAAVGQRLEADAALSGARVAARSHGGVVALVGEVPDERQKFEAARVAGAVAGVTRVDNLILVVKGDSRAAGSAPAKEALILARTD
jgi:hypothetical protein